jgi:C-terminal processing protease CtpA/Prc
MLGALLLLAAPALPPAEVQVENLKAFAVLYGYVRFFHPSEEAARVDWEKLALVGVPRVRAAETPEDLERALEGIFRPLAPTMRLFTEGQEPQAPLDLWPDFRENLVVVAWQHQGVDLGNPTIYQSARTHRPRPGLPSFGTVLKALAAAPHRGKSVRLRASVKARVEGSGNQGQLWLRVDRPNGRVGFFDNMSDRPVTMDAWGTFEIEGHIDEDAQQLVFGGFLKGEGSVWLDAFELQVREADGSYSAIDVENPGFESGSGLSGWHATSDTYLYRVEESGCLEGRRCLLIAFRPGASYQLFDAVPEVGEVAATALPRGLRAEVPVALYGDAVKTYGGRTDESGMEELRRAFESLAPSVLDQRLAAVVIAWNVFQHFYPYFDVVDTDWAAVLERSLQEALEASDEAEFRRVLKRLAEALRDGHARVLHPDETKGLAWLPIAFDWIEGRVVVTRSEVSTISPGDVVTSLGAEAASSILARVEALISGSPQWKRYRALANSQRCPEETEVELGLSRDGEELARTVPCSRSEPLAEPRPDPISRLAEDVVYVDLTRVSYEEVEPRLEELAAAQGLVFDMRGYPKSGAERLLCHLADQPLLSAKWMIPRILYPGRVNLVGYQLSRWNLAPQSPRLRAKAIFLTHAGAISYAESVMGIVEHYRLGEIVGQPTAGANGNVNPFALPGGYRVFWTGMRVVKHDDRQHHLIGILPTVPLSRTIAAVRQGRDEYLEKALSLLQ